MKRARSQKRKAAATVVYSLFEFCRKLRVQTTIFLDLQRNEIDKWKCQNIFCVCGTL